MKKKIKHPPFQWFGGKWEMAKWIIPHFPDHHAYVEPFGGAASVLLQKEPSPVEVYNDLDDHVANFFRVARDHTDELVRRVALSPYHRGEYWDAVKSIDDEPDDIERARLFIVVARQSISGAWGRAWSCQRTHSRRGLASGNSRWLNVVASIYQVADRLMEVQIDSKSAIEIINDYDTQNTLFYCDPPYHPATCSSGVYRCTMDEDDHFEFLMFITNIKGRAVISGYDHPLYDEMLSKWKRVDREVPCRSNVNAKGTNGNRPTRTERLWVSPSESR